MSLGQAIRTARHASTHSTWQYEDADAITQLEGEKDALWQELDNEHAKKKAILEDDLARELYAEATRLLASQHESDTQMLCAWTSTKATYLRVREDVDSIAAAQNCLGAFDMYLKEFEGMTTVTVTSLKQLGEMVCARSYTSKYSCYGYANSNEEAQLKEREAVVDGHWVTLATLAAKKRQFLDDNLARNHYQEKIRLWVASHKDLYTRVVQWIEEKKTQLTKKSFVDDTQEARLQLSLLSAYKLDKEETSMGILALLKKTGEEIRNATYRSLYSAWSYENPGGLLELESSVDAQLAGLFPLSDAKQAVLEDDLAREQFKENVRLWVQNHRALFCIIKSFYTTGVEYLSTKEVTLDSVQAKVAINTLASFEMSR